MTWSEKKKYLSTVNIIKLEKGSLIHFAITEKVLIQPRPRVTLARIGNNKLVPHHLCHSININMCCNCLLISLFKYFWCNLLLGLKAKV